MQEGVEEVAVGMAELRDKIWDAGIEIGEREDEGNSRPSGDKVMPVFLTLWNFRQDVSFF